MRSGRNGSKLSREVKRNRPGPTPRHASLVLHTFSFLFLLRERTQSDQSFAAALYEAPTRNENGPVGWMERRLPVDLAPIICGGAM